MKIKHFSKTIIGILMFTLILGFVTSTISSTYAYMPGVKVEKVSQDPDPGLPNRLLEVKLKIINTDRDPVNLTVSIIPEWPFKKYREISKNIELMGYQLGTYAQIVDFYVIINDSTPPGTYKLKVKYTDGSSYIIKEIPIKIENDEVLFNIENLKVEPQKIVDSGKVSFNLHNIGTISAKDVKIKLMLPNGFSIKNTDTKNYLSFGKNEIKTITYEFETDPNIKPGMYSGKILIDYYNDDRTKHYSSEYNFGIIVNTKNKVYSFVEHYEYNEKKKTVEISIDVVNKGSQDIKYVKVKILPGDYKIVNGIGYIGDIDAGDYDSVDLAIEPKKENFTLNYEVEWANYFNEEFKQKNSEELKVEIPKDKTGKNKIKQYGLILLGILLAIFWVFMLIDAIESEQENKVKKWLWIIIIIATLPLGALLYYLFGRKK